MAEDLRIIIGFSVNEADAKINLNSAIEQLEKKINKLNIQLDIDKNTLKTIQDTLSQLGKFNGDGFSKLSKDATNFNKEIQKANQELKKLYAEREKYIKEQKRSLEASEREFWNRLKETPVRRPQKGQDMYEEFYSGINAGIRKNYTTNNPLAQSLDEVAEQFNMTSDSLLQKMKQGISKIDLSSYSDEVTKEFDKQIASQKELQKVLERGAAEGKEYGDVVLGITQHTKEATLASEKHERQLQNEAKAMQKLSQTSKETRKITTSYDTDNNGNIISDKPRSVTTVTGDKFQYQSQKISFDENRTPIASPITEVFDAEKLKEAEKNLERFVNDASSRLDKIDKAFGTTTKEVRDLIESIELLNAHSTKSDFNAVEKQLKSVEQLAKVQENRIKDEAAAWDAAYREKEKKETYLHGNRVQDIYRAYDLALEEDRKYNDKRQKTEQEVINYKNKLAVENYQKLQDLERKRYQDQQKQEYDLEKQHAIALLQNQRRDQEYTRKQQAILDKIESSRLKYGHHKGVESVLDQAVIDAKAVKNIGDYDNQFKNINTSISKATAGLKAARRETISFGDAMSTAMQKFPVWMLATTAFYAPLRGLQDMVSTIIEVDSQLTQLKRVMDEGTNFDEMLSGSIELSNELARSIKEVNNNMIGFARMGFTEDQTLALAKTATLFQNISELTPDEAVDSMTAAMTVFNIKAEDSIRIADSLNEVDNRFAVTSKDLAISLNKAGSAANTFGISMEKVVGDTTAIATATRESGAVIGNSLKTIYSRLTTMDKSEEVLDSVGISMKNMSGEVREGSEILDELAGKWNSLSKEQQQNVAVQLAGRYQLTR